MAEMVGRWEGGEVGRLRCGANAQAVAIVEDGSAATTMMKDGSVVARAEMAEGQGWTQHVGGGAGREAEGRVGVGT